MQSSPECIPCVFRQALNTSRVVTRDPALQLRILQRVAAAMAHARTDVTPALLSEPVYRIIPELTGVADPYARAKRASNRAALALLPRLERIVRRSRDPLKAAIHLAAAGNVIDLGIGHSFDMARDVEKLMRRPFAIDDYADFGRELKRGCRLLYLGDNAGEIVFDRVLVEYLLAVGANVTFVVKASPVINDATLADARSTGIAKLVPVITTGSNAIGVGWTRTSREFRQALKQADLIIGKGHGNFETCCDRPENFYFLLKAKCPVVAAELGVQEGDTVFKHRAIHKAGRRSGRPTR